MRISSSTLDLGSLQGSRVEIGPGRYPQFLDGEVCLQGAVDRDGSSEQCKSGRGRGGKFRCPTDRARWTGLTLVELVGLEHPGPWNTAEQGFFFRDAEGDSPATATSGGRTGELRCPLLL